MFIGLISTVGAIALVWSARYYTDFIARDPYDFDRGPAWYSKLASMALLTLPFALVLTGAHLVQTILYNGLLSLAVSSLIVPAVFANRTGEGMTWLANMAEKSVAALLLAGAVSFLTANIPGLWWYGLLVVAGAFSMWSRRLLLLVSIQDENKPAQWNDMRVRAMRTFISRATLSYWVLVIGLGLLVQHSHVGVGTWNTGLKQLWQPLWKAFTQS